MTSQIADGVRYQDRRYVICAVDGAGLFEPAEHGVAPGPLSTACWRGFICTYLIRHGQLLLDTLEIGRRGDRPATVEVFGVRASDADASAMHRGALQYRDLAAPVAFTGRLLLGAEAIHVGYLNMGFRPAWTFARVQEVAFRTGRLISAHDRSAALAEVRHRLGAGGLKPATDTPTSAWIEQTFSLTFDYSWPNTD